jgi:hypothetical protein
MELFGDGDILHPGLAVFNDDRAKQDKIGLIPSDALKANEDHVTKFTLPFDRLGIDRDLLSAGIA